MKKGKGTGLRAACVAALALTLVGCGSLPKATRADFQVPPLRPESAWPGEVDFASQKLPGAVLDVYIGFTEKLIRAMYGNPKNEFVRAVRYYRGEMYVTMTLKLKDWPSVRVKQLSYEMADRSKVFWLVRNDARQWVVISDATIPPGVEF